MGAAVAFLRAAALGRTILSGAQDALAAPFLVYGSGDFHNLTALRLRLVAESIVLVAFDNHPDWDVRPPKWGCGGWVNRALELSNVRLAGVWGWALFMNHFIFRVCV